MSKVFEVWIDDGTSNEDVYRELRGSLVGLTAPGGVYSGRHVDLRAFDAVGPAVDWLGVVGWR